jgi:hypothetical protein
MKRGYARNGRDEQRLIKAGLKAKDIYVEGRGKEGFGNWRMRNGETLHVVEGLRALGNSRREIVDKFAMIRGWGATIEDAETGERASDDGVAMLDKALAKLKGERTIAGRAEDMQAASVRARTKGRLEERKAQIIWQDARWTVGEAIARMPGWSLTTAYKAFGKRNLPIGRRGSKR